MKLLTCQEAVKKVHERIACFIKAGLLPKMRYSVDKVSDGPVPLGESERWGINVTVVYLKTPIINPQWLDGRGLKYTPHADAVLLVLQSILLNVAKVPEGLTGVARFSLAYEARELEKLEAKARAPAAQHDAAQSVIAL